MNFIRNAAARVIFGPDEPSIIAELRAHEAAMRTNPAAIAFDREIRAEIFRSMLGCAAFVLTLIAGLAWAILNGWLDAVGSVLGAGATTWVPTVFILGTVALMMFTSFAASMPRWVIPIFYALSGAFGIFMALVLAYLFIIVYSLTFA